MAADFKHGVAINYPPASSEPRNALRFLLFLVILVSEAIDWTGRCEIDKKPLNPAAQPRFVKSAWPLFEWIVLPPLN